MSARRQQEITVNYPVASLLKRVLQLFRETLDESLRPYGITAAQLHLLAKLDKEAGISGARLARACRITPQTAQVLLRGMEKNGWVRRAKHPENERILLATLTPSGKRILAKSRIALRRIYERMLGDLKEKDVSALEGLLSRCASNLEGRRSDALRAR